MVRWRGFNFRKGIEMMTFKWRPIRHFLKYVWETYRWAGLIFALGAAMAITWLVSAVPDPVHVQLWKPDRSTVLGALSFKDGTPSVEVSSAEFERRVGNGVPSFVVLWDGWTDGPVDLTNDGVEKNRRLTVTYVSLVTLPGNMSTYISAKALLPDYMFFSYVGKVHLDRENLTFDFYSDGERRGQVAPVIGSVLMGLALLLALLIYVLNRPDNREPFRPQRA